MLPRFQLERARGEATDAAGYDFPGSLGNSDSIASVSYNPAHLRILSSTRFLMLQGPVGPFFDRLALWLMAQKKTVHRVVFQAGDLSDCKALTPIPFVGTKDEWRDYLRALIANLGIDCLLLFGQSRYYHQVARELAEETGTSVIVFEEGYFRPGFVTMELGGVNGYSRTMTLYRWRPQAECSEGIAPDIAAWHFQKMCWHAARHYLFMRKFVALFNNYHHHRITDPRYYAGYWLRSWLIKLVKRWPDMAFQRKLFAEKRSYYLVPLQHDGDAQITHHSPYSQNTDFIIQVLRSFADNAPKDRWLIFRQHPHSRGGPGHSKLIFSLAKELGVSCRVHHMVEGDTPDLAQNSVGVILINSTVGLQALERGVPLMVLGAALYKQPGLVHEGTLDSFWHGAARPPREETCHFLAQMKNLTQMPCSVYANRKEPLLWPV